MKKVLLMITLVPLFAAGAWAEAPVETAVTAEAVETVETAETVIKAIQDSGALKGVDAAKVGEWVNGLVESGASVTEAKDLIMETATNAQVQALEGEALLARIDEAVNGQKDALAKAKAAQEHPSAPAEHPASDKPKDHPAH